jgi:flagellar assembly factor FliW
MLVNTSRFGEITVEDSAVIKFPEGIVGFPDLRGFVIFDGPEGTPFKWLQSTDRAELAFVICDPMLFKADYRVSASREELANLELAKPDDAVICVILSIPADPWKMTANLMGPVIFNAERKLGKQLVLAGPQYTTKHPVFPDGKPGPLGGTAPADSGPGGGKE